MGVVSVRVNSVCTQHSLDLDLKPHGGTIKLGVQLLPLAETMWMPAALSAEREQRELAQKRSKALETSLNICQDEVSGLRNRCSALELALDAESSEKAAAKEKAEELKAAMQEKANKSEADL